MEVGEAAPRTVREAKNTAPRSAFERLTLGYCDKLRIRIGLAKGRFQITVMSSVLSPTTLWN